MGKKWIAVCLTFCFAGASLAQDVIRGTYSYTYGDSESLVDARKTCKDLALREAIESYYIFVRSSTEVENYQLKDDLIQSVSAGYLSNIQIIDQTEEGRTITITVEATVDPQEVQSLVDQKIKEMGGEDITETSDAGSESAGDSTGQYTLLRRIVEFEQRMDRAEGNIKMGKTGTAVAQLNDLAAILDKLDPAREGSFASRLQRVMLRYIDLLTLWTRHETTDVARRAAARSQPRTIIQSAGELKAALVPLENMQGLPAGRRHLQTKWVNRSQGLLDQVRAAFPRAMRR